MAADVQQGRGVSVPQEDDAGVIAKGEGVLALEPATQPVGIEARVVRVPFEKKEGASQGAPLIGGEPLDPALEAGLRPAGRCGCPAAATSTAPGRDPR